MPAPGPRRAHRDLSRQQLVLVLSRDPVAAALLGGLIETLGYAVCFARLPEVPEESVRRLHPRICLIDCTDAHSCRTEFLARATMRGVSVVIYGTTEALERARTTAMAHDIEMLRMPPTTEDLELVLQRAGTDP